LKRTIVVVDTVWTGHVPSFHKLILAGFLDLGYSVASISPAPQDVVKYLQSKGYDSSLFIPIGFEQPTRKERSIIHRFTGRFAHRSLWLKKIATVLEAKLLWKTTAKLISKHVHSNTKFVFFPYIDRGFALPNLNPKWIEQNFPFQWGGLHINGHQLQDRSSQIPLKAKNCKSVCLLDERITDSIAQQLNKPVYWFPEVVEEQILPDETPKLVQEIQSKANGRKIVSLIGVLSSSKDIETLLGVIQLSSELGKPYYFLIVGELLLSTFPDKLQTLIQSFLSAPPENVWIHTDRIEDEGSFNSLYACSDIIFAMYKDFQGSSNTLSKSAYFRKPIIVTQNEYLIAQRVNKHKLGQGVREGGTEKCLKAIEDLCAQLASGQQFGFEKYMALNSRDILHKILESSISQG